MRRLLLWLISQVPAIFESFLKNRAYFCFWNALDMSDRLPG